MMGKGHWWEGHDRERFWLEATDRNDLGTDLRAPNADQSGAPNWRYLLFREAKPGDVVFHYDKRRSAITSISRISANVVEAPIVWAARGTYARDKKLQPTLQPGYRIALDQFHALDESLPLDEIRAKRTQIEALVAELSSKQFPLYFPFELGNRPIRPLQGYAFKLPASFVALFPQLSSDDLVSDSSADKFVGTNATIAFRMVLKDLGIGSFSTYDFIERYRAEYPQEWVLVEQKHGVGGKGAGKHYSSFTYVSQVLNGLSRDGELEKLDYRPAPFGWGNSVIRYWTLNRKSLGGGLFPDEVSDEYAEGGKTQVVVNKYERNRKARQRCIEYHGMTCKGCGADFEKRYGPHGAGFIHVHHLVPVSQTNGPYKLDPITDLIPVCPNCHAMIHYREPMLTIEQLKSILSAASPTFISNI